MVPVWPQGLIRVGNHRIVAYLVTMEVHGTHQDTGDVWLSAFDLDWNHVETVEVAVEPSDWWAYSRPFVTRKGNVLLVTYDHANGNQMSVVTVDLGALGVESGDTGLPDPDSGDDTGDSSGPGGAADCGCSGIAHSGSSGWLLGLLGALVGRRRQSSPA